MNRAPGLSVRLKLTLSYAAFLMLAGTLLLAAVWVFLLRYVPDRALLISAEDNIVHGVFPVRSNLLHEFAPRAAAVLLFLLVVGLVGGWFLAGRMLAPLTRITDATRMAAKGSLSHRVQLPGRNDEFREFADTFDNMLERLEAHVAEQQRFAANASHELRTPLATTQTLLDVARNDPNRDTGELIDRLYAVNARAIDLTEALLVLSRADQRSFNREDVDLSLLAEEAVETLIPLAEKYGVTIESSGDIARATGSRSLLLQLTTNLVHNAIVHNRAEQGIVWISTRVQPECVVLTVENTGEILTSDLVSTLAEPFRRGTERLVLHVANPCDVLPATSAPRGVQNARRYSVGAPLLSLRGTNLTRNSIHRDLRHEALVADHAGVGLGLAIVKSVTEAHDGTLTLTPRDDGGLRVEVLLPVAKHHY